MAQSHPWMSLAEASSRLGLDEFQVLDLAVSGRLHSQLKHHAREISAAAVDEFASELATRSGDVLAEHANRPAWKPWTDPDFRREQADYTDTPNDEGDEQ
jgi:hypothetical protein